MLENEARTTGKNTESKNADLQNIDSRATNKIESQKLDSIIEIIGVFDAPMLASLNLSRAQIAKDKQDLLAKKAMLESAQKSGIIALATFAPKDFSVMGFSAILRKISFFYRAQARLLSLALSADKVMLMDSSSFHIRLARKIRHAQESQSKNARKNQTRNKQAQNKQMGENPKKAQIIYYILPQLWAWKPWRAKEMERYCDKLLAILPFELEWYSERARQSGQIAYVGHPLLDELDFSTIDKRVQNLTKTSALDSSKSAMLSITQNLATRENPATHQNLAQNLNQTIAQTTQNPNADTAPPSQNVSPQSQHCPAPPSKNTAQPPCIIFMPGSRRGEIARIFPIFCEVAENLKHARKILVIPSIFARENLKDIYENQNTAGALEKFELCFDTKSALEMADFGFICSGTATLEAALMGVPFVLGYKSSPLDYFIAKRLVSLRYIGLANIFYNALNGEKAGRGDSQMHQELIQEKMSAQNLLDAYHNANALESHANARKLRAYLKHGSALNVANILRD